VRAALAALALSGCATEEIPMSFVGECDDASIADLVGRPATAELGAEAMRRSGAQRVRWLRPNDVMTMDFSGVRLNIHLDSNGRVDHFDCG